MTVPWQRQPAADATCLVAMCLEWSADSLLICLCYSGGRVRLMPRQGMHGCREHWKRWSASKLCCRSSVLLIEITRM